MRVARDVVVRYATRCFRFPCIKNEYMVEVDVSRSRPRVVMCHGPSRRVSYMIFNCKKGPRVFGTGTRDKITTRKIPPKHTHNNILSYHSSHRLYLFRTGSSPSPPSAIRSEEVPPDEVVVDGDGVANASHSDDVDASRATALRMKCMVARSGRINNLTARRCRSVVGVGVGAVVGIARQAVACR